MTSVFVRTAIAAVAFLSGAPLALALDPTLAVSQYAHTGWTVRDGFSLGNIYAMAQTPDGYLWFGTEFGLVRFDGVTSTPWQPPSGQQLPDRNINSLLVERTVVAQPRAQAPRLRGTTRLVAGEQPPIRRTPAAAA